jgi:hypothetical protein
VLQFAQNFPLERRINHLYRLPTNCSAGTNDNLPDSYGVSPTASARGRCLTGHNVFSRDVAAYIYLNCVIFETFINQQ